jgi:hypothetical protein
VWRLPPTVAAMVGRTAARVRTTSRAAGRFPAEHLVHGGRQQRGEHLVPAAGAHGPDHRLPDQGLEPGLRCGGRAAGGRRRLGGPSERRHRSGQAELPRRATRPRRRRPTGRDRVPAAPPTRRPRRLPHRRPGPWPHYSTRSARTPAPRRQPLRRGHGVLGRCRPAGRLVERDGTGTRPKLLGALSSRCPRTPCVPAVTIRPGRHRSVNAPSRPSWPSTPRGGPPPTTRNDNTAGDTSG